MTMDDVLLTVTVCDVAFKEKFDGNGKNVGTLYDTVTWTMFLGALLQPPLQVDHVVGVVELACSHCVMTSNLAGSSPGYPNP